MKYHGDADPVLETAKILDELTSRMERPDDDDDLAAMDEGQLLSAALSYLHGRPDTLERGD